MTANRSAGNPSGRVAVLGYLSLLTVVLFGTIVEAASITLTPVADTTLQESYPTNNFGDGTTIQAGERRYGGRTRALLRFDLSSNVPPNAIITAATVTLTVVATPSGAVNSIFDLNRLLALWGEGSGPDHRGTNGQPGEATWINRLGPGTPWAIPGGDIVATASATRAITNNGVYTFNTTTALVSNVQNWLTNPASNFGWLLRSESESSPTTIRRFGARTDVVNSPVLTLTYSMPPRLESASLTGVTFQFQFQAVAGRSNVVERRGRIASGVW